MPLTGRRPLNSAVRLPTPISVTVVLLLSAFPALAFSPWQRHGGPPPRQSAPPPSQNMPPAAPASNGGYTFHPKGPGPHHGDWLRKYGSLPPNQQEQQLQKDPTFRKLSPEKQSKLLNRLREFNNQTPEKKAQILNNMETFEHMTPQQQQAVRSLFGRYHNLPEDRKTKVSQAYRRLRGMPPSARNELLNSDEFRNNYTDEERELLRGMADLNVGPTR